jgi:hypothetical protein
METKLAEAKTKHRDLLDANVVYRTLSKVKGLETRARLRVGIARKVAQITFWFHRDENTPKLVPEAKDRGGGDAKRSKQIVGVPNRP